MNTRTKFLHLPVLLAMALLSACGQREPSQAASDMQPQSAIEKIKQGADKEGSVDSNIEQQGLNNQVQGEEPLEFKIIKWTDLMPKEDLEALLNPPKYLDNIEDGSEMDQIGGQLKSSSAAASDDPYQQALVSTKIKPEMNGKAIRIPGFVVPLEFGDDEMITEFFLVPFFGACIHEPPPPPNQIILVHASGGIKLEVLYDPFWVSGVLKTTLNENDVAISAYEMNMIKFEEYNVEDAGV